jgi:hypothetical protein
MQALVRTALLVGAIAACHTGAQNTHDGGGDDDTDGAIDAPGLSVRWATKAPIPGDIATDITVSDMLYRMANLRVIGDAGPGDTRTSQDTFQVTWDTGVTPPTITFTDAPSGLYSKVVLLADANFIDYAYEIHGTVKLNGNTMPYKIHDRSPIGVSLDTSAMLDPGKGTSITVRLDMAKAFEGLDFTKLTNDSGTLELDTFDDQMSDFRGRMVSDVFDAPHEGQN